MHGRRVQQEKAQLDNVEDKVEEHVHRHNDARHAVRRKAKVYDVSGFVRKAGLSGWKKRSCVLRRGLLARVQVRGKEEVRKKVLARKDRGKHAPRQKGFPKATQGGMVRPENMGARHQEESGKVHAKD